jgi:hypothetical protein
VFGKIIINAFENLKRVLYIKRDSKKFQKDLVFKNRGSNNHKNLKEILKKESGKKSQDDIIFIFKS